MATSHEAHEHAEAANTGDNALIGAKRYDEAQIEASSPESDAGHVARNIRTILARREGRLPATALCSQLYKECDIAKDIIAKHKGIKAFISKFAAQDVEFVPGQVRSPCPRARRASVLI